MDILCLFFKKVDLAGGALVSSGDISLQFSSLSVETLDIETAIVSVTRT